jgi:hypothetical protein
VCLYSYPLIVARKRLSKNVPGATNTQTTTEVGLVVFYAVRVVLKKSRCQFFPELLVKEMKMAVR